MRLGRLQSYGDLKGSTRSERGDLADQPDGDIAQMPGAGAAMPDFLMTQRA